MPHQDIEECRKKSGDSLRGHLKFPNLSPGVRNQALDDIVSHADIVPEFFQFKVSLTATL
ncbi:hypothetical protein CFAM422_008354 [Trichoderma lentiforme]|uniref:Uncharacterized protein n=1 Tax=Trichoderma lentiforme TaxID=1567552 RepID=A0A9P4XCB7_9HYPO|nr:hypothetical protein CFAM422_008354 [Trichoderma lentiforme]